MTSNKRSESETTVRQLQPIAPPNLKALTSHESATIDLSWTSVPNATSYEIQRSPAYYFISNFITLVTISNTSMTKYTDQANLTNGETYYYKIAASDGRSTGRFSSIVEATPQFAPPVDFKAATGQESASISLFWAPVVGATTYEIQRSLTENHAAKLTTILTISNTSMTKYTDQANLTNGETYYYKIAASDGRSTGRFSSIVEATPQFAPPVDFKAATGEESASIDLSWKFVDGATRYEIYRSSNNNNAAKFTRVAIISDITMYNYVDQSNLINGEIYYYKIAASDGRSIGRFSSIVEATPQFAPPGNFKAVTSEESASIDLSWTFVDGATGYEICRSSNNNNATKFTRVATISKTTTTSYTDKSNLINRQTYYYKIAAIDSRSTGRFSSIVETTAEFAPPGNFKAVTGEESASIDLSWTFVVGAIGYEIQRSSAYYFRPNFNTIATISNTSTTNYTDKSNLTNGETYYYKIAASDDLSTTLFSSIVHAIPKLTPPDNFKALTGQESASIDLLWRCVVGATGYEIQRSSNNNDAAKFTTIATISKTTTTKYVDKSYMINGQTYYYKIAAKDGRSTSSFSSIVHAITELAPPRDFKAVTGRESASIELSWKSVDGATRYEIYRSSTNNDAANFTTIRIFAKRRTTNYVDRSNLVNGQTYYYRIAASDDQSTGRFSSTLRAVPELTPPGNFKAVTSEESASIDLSWACVFGATGYEIQRSSTNNDGADFTAIAAIANTSTTNYTDKSNLINGESYYYKIATRDDRSTTSFSSIAQAIPELAVPGNFKAVTGEESASIDLSWTFVDGATGYEIYRSSNNNNATKFTRVATISKTTTTNYIDKSNLINRQTYYYKIAAIDSRSTGRFSSIVEGIPQFAPPVDFKAATGEESASIDLSWKFVDGATGYEIYRSSNNNNAEKFARVAIISNITTYNYVDQSNLTNGETYYYKIAASDGRSTGRFSSIVEATPQFPPPGNFEAVTGQESAAIDLSWKFVDGATGYEIYRSSNNNNATKFTRVATISKTTTTNYIDKSNLINRQTYYYKIAAIDSRSTGRFSLVINADTHVGPPRNLQAIPIYGSCAVLLRWESIKEATGYNIKRSSMAGKVPEETIKTVSNGSVSSYVDQELTDGCTYCYVMTSKDGPDESVYTSNMVSAVPLVNEPTTLIRAPPGDKGTGFRDASNDRISVRKGDLTKENVDVIVVASSSDELRKTILKAAGPLVEQAYRDSVQANRGHPIIVTPNGQLPCGHIFFLQWHPKKDSSELQKSLKDFVCKAIQKARELNCTKIAFPAIGCGEHGCPIAFVAETMISETRNQLKTTNHRIEVIFILLKDRDDLYAAFTKCLGQHKIVEAQLPPTWKVSTDNQLRYLVATDEAEYKSVLTNFDQTMKGRYTQVIKLERIQNKRWFIQYSVHRQDFIERLKSDTEKILYHGCPEQAADSIIQDCFNRSFAGVNATAYGFGVYFSSNAADSHGYTRKNAKGERCMFVSRVLIGQSTVGNRSMRTRPVGFDSTTDGNSIFVTYHDAQAYAEYLITYK